MAALPNLPRVYVDFNGLLTARPYRVALDIPATRADLERNGLEFKEGFRCLFFDLDFSALRNPDDLLAVGTMERDDNWGWIGVIEGDIHHESEWQALDEA